MIAVGLVLSAVFVPCAFISGIMGQFFRQFALTIAVSTVISAFNSLTLSPALAALLLASARGDRARTKCCRCRRIPLLGGWLGYWLFLDCRGRAELAAAMGIAALLSTVRLAAVRWWSPRRRRLSCGVPAGLAAQPRPGGAFRGSTRLRPRDRRLHRRRRRVAPGQR